MPVLHVGIGDMRSPDNTLTLFNLLKPKSFSPAEAHVGKFELRGKLVYAGLHACQVTVVPSAAALCCATPLTARKNIMLTGNAVYVAVNGPAHGATDLSVMVGVAATTPRLLQAHKLAAQPQANDL